MKSLSTFRIRILWISSLLWFFFRVVTWIRFVLLQFKFMKFGWHWQWADLHNENRIFRARRGEWTFGDLITFYLYPMRNQRVESYLCLLIHCIYHCIYMGFVCVCFSFLYVIRLILCICFMFYFLLLFHSL